MTGPEFDQQISLDAAKRSAFFVIDREALAAHFTSRADHHRGRSQHYREKSEAFEREAKEEMQHLEGDDALMNKSNSSYGNRSNQLELARAKSIEHARLALKFQWFSEHLSARESVYLDLHMVGHFELVP